MRKQCVPGASPFFARAGDEAKVVCFCRRKWLRQKLNIDDNLVVARYMHDSCLAAGHTLVTLLSQGSTLSTFGHACIHVLALVP